MPECKDCIHYEACMHLIDAEHESLIVCEYFKSVSDIAAAKRGTWEANDMGCAVEYRCSLCGYTYCEADPTCPPEKYCCKCGAEND